MNFSAKLLPLLIIVAFSSTIVFSFYLPLITKQGKPPIYYAMAAQGQNIVDLEPDQSFSGAAGSIIEYNIYIENKRQSATSYKLSALSDKGYFVEVWRDTDQIGSGDLQLIPPQGSIITMRPGEIATLIVKVIIPSDAPDGTVDNTIIEAANAASGASDSVTVTTTVDFDLPYPSNWIQLGSDPTFPIPPPERIDVKAFYYTNNGTHVFFRMAQAEMPNTQAFLYSVYLDTKAGGQQIDSYNYDYLLSSDGILYEWSGTNWINSGYPTHRQVYGTAIVHWADLDNLSMDTQEIHFLARITTKGGVLKDKLGPFSILKSSISEIPLILIPILSFSIYFIISRGTEKWRTSPR